MEVTLNTHSVCTTQKVAKYLTFSLFIRSSLSPEKKNVLKSHAILELTEKKFPRKSSQSEARWSGRKNTAIQFPLMKEIMICKQHMQLLRIAKCLDADFKRVIKCNFQGKGKEIVIL